MDSLQQLPPLQTMDNLRPYQDHIQDLWLNVPHQPPWHSWKLLPQDLNLPIDLDLQPWQTIVGKRKICINEEMDILHWGYTPSRTFTIKESYHLQENFRNQLKEHIWNIIWKTQLWPKVSTFLWLLVRNCILTRDNLKKCGFIGLSIFYLCQQHEETMEHIFNQCTSSNMI
jgi:hypothetical protein